jgi:N-6 DNA Methylase
VGCAPGRASARVAAAAALLAHETQQHAQVRFPHLGGAVARAEESARRQLEQAGYEYVRTHHIVTSAAQRRLVVDLVAWAADPSGAVRPYAAVEVKDRLAEEGGFEGALAQLAVPRDLLGTSAHYIFDGREWYEADAGLRTARRLPGAPLAPPHVPTTLADADVAARLLTERVWQQMDAQREQDPNVALLRGLLDELAAAEGRLPFGRHLLNVPPPVLWKATQQVARWALTRQRAFAEFTTEPALVTSMALLLGPWIQGVVFDPFAGIGSSLWAVAERAAAAGERQVELRGTEINQETAQLARGLAGISPYEIAIESADSFTAAVQGLADFVITEPPAGLKLAEPYRIESVGDTRDGDVASIDLAVRALKPGGRAVIHLPLGWTFRSGTVARYRDHLLDTAQVTALIGLPSGAYANTMLPSALLVVDRKPGTGETFVAQLGEDWAAQLGPGGSAFAAFEEHTDWAVS